MPSARMLALAALIPFALATPVARQASAQTWQIHPNGDSTRCLSVLGAQNDSPVHVYSCTLPYAGQYMVWELAEGDNLSVKLAGTNFCLDAGSKPSNNGPAKIYQCYPGLSQQHWYYTSDEHLAITGGNQCLDTGGPTANQSQTYKCTGGNTNQIFSLSSTPAPVSYTPPASYPTTTSASSTSAVSATTTSSAPTSTGTPFYAPYNGTQLYFNDNTRQCLTVLGGNAVPGAVASLVDCFSAVNPYIDLQLWNLTRGVTNVRLAATPSLCLDFGSTPKNGAQVKVSGCSNVPQQQFYYTADNRLAIYNGDQCLDVAAGSQPSYNSPYGSLANVQSWACTTGNTQQVWDSFL